VQPYAIEYSLGGNQIMLLDMGNGKHEYRVEVAVLAFDEVGKRVAGQELTIAGKVSDAELQKFQSSDYHVHQTIQMPEHAAMLRLALRDVRTGHVGSLQIPVSAISSPYERKRLDVPPPTPQLKLRH